MSYGLIGPERTGERHPLKQGLKRKSERILMIHIWDWRKTSTKTRIETMNCNWSKIEILTGERHPLKQGLKHDNVGVVDVDGNTGERHPLKQG